MWLWWHASKIFHCFLHVFQLKCPLRVQEAHSVLSKNREAWTWQQFIANSLLHLNVFATHETLQCLHGDVSKPACGHRVLCEDETFISWWNDKLRHIQRCGRFCPWKQLLRSINMPRAVHKHCHIELSNECRQTRTDASEMTFESLSSAQMLKDFSNVSMSFGLQPTLSPLSTLGNASLSVFFSLCLWADYYELARECGLKVNVFWLLVYVQYVSPCLMKQDSSLPRDMSNKDKQPSENRCETNDTGACFSPRRFLN